MTAFAAVVVIPADINALPPASQNHLSIFCDAFDFNRRAYAFETRLIRGTDDTALAAVFHIRHAIHTSIIAATKAAGGTTRLAAANLTLVATVAGFANLPSFFAFGGADHIRFAAVGKVIITIEKS